LILVVTKSLKIGQYLKKL